ncbi:protein SEEDLING PLASTID DEVELOPMENT 1 [Benincasa hispida]|uniref:protein SEEDLING PLASTID DEVELOPMENT 1 n=1 Tax=Benincasa hispida TaxID=102211 RepID=UPI001902A170|nr:protein SEEDLING PLASTID DEVELOPMENT 1 [Benincasa hispida]
MRALNSHFLLIDLHSSWHSANQIPISTLAYLQNSHSVSKFSSSFRRTRRVRKGVVSSESSAPSFRSPEIRRPSSDRLFSGNGLLTNLSNSNSNLDSDSASTSSQSEATAELEMFIELLPSRMRKELSSHTEFRELIEVVLDLGRNPIARFPSGDWAISEEPVKHEDLSHAISKVGDFSDDNRSGMDRSLHRISAIRNRKMQIIGLTCRVGRSVSGSAEIIRDLVEGGGSILVIGPPGVGKTTLIREIARMLADDHKKRVVIVDTSNEIGGDGDVPHAGIGSARRMQVPNVNMQHTVMIEAVENHMPETIIIDEIGTELEALAASTIAQRGVQLVGTAHGITIDNIIKNPSLQILVGGIESVTLGDEEARKRKVQKTILERKGPSTFTCAVEMISKTECRVHHRLDTTVDAILAGKTPLFEVRHVDTYANHSMGPSPNHVKSFGLHERLPSKDGNIIADSDSNLEVRHMETYANHSMEPSRKHETSLQGRVNLKDHNIIADHDSDIEDVGHFSHQSKSRPVSKKSSPVRVYTYKILESDLLQVAQVLGLENEIDVTDDIESADAILATSNEMKQNPWVRSVAKFHHLPVFVIKSNTMAQMVKAIRMIIKIDSSSTTKKPRKTPDIVIEDDAPKRKPSLEEIDALEEVRLAIEYIVIPGGEPVELLPRRSEIVARQLELVESYQLAAEYSSSDPNPRLQILPLRLKNKNLKEPKSSSKPLTGEGTGISRLPLLPE